MMTTTLLLALLPPLAPQELDPGLVAEYFRAPGGAFEAPASRPLLVRVEPVLDVPLAEGEFPGTRLSERFFARWTGVLRCPVDGMYGFYVESDDGCRLYLDGELVIDHRSSRLMEQKSERIDLKAGDHEVRMEYLQTDGPAGVNLQWKTPVGKREKIPAGALFHRRGSVREDADRAAWEALPPAPPRKPVVIGRPGRYAVMDYGPALARTLAGKPAPRVLSGLCVKVGAEASVVFDMQKLRWAAAWTGSFLRFPAERDGVAGFPEIAGEVRLSSPPGPGVAYDGSWTDDPGHPNGPLPKERGRWRGHYVHGPRVVLSYTAGPVGILELPGFEAGVFTRTLKIAPAEAPVEILLAEGDLEASVQGPGTLRRDGARLVLRVEPRREAVRIKVALPKAAVAPPEDPEAFVGGGPARWTAPVAAKGSLGREPGAYAVDTIPVPEENPWDSYMRLSGLDFFPDGRAAVSTLDGDVWIVSGIDSALERVVWKRFAAGLYQPMGLVVRDGDVYALGRDQITRLADLNGDGEADFHENFNNDCLLSGSFHEFTMDLQADPGGNFYFAKAATLGYASGTTHNGCVMKVSRDGSTLEVFALGFRTPFGLCVGPEGQITATDQQGNWMGTCPIVWVERGRFYGHVLAERPETKSMPREPALCWIPMDMDNSSGGQVWAVSERWGPLQGRLIHSSYGQARLFTVLIDEGGAKARQGGVARLPWTFSSGVHRLRMNPADGQLYAAGLRGWQTTGVKDGCLQRVRHTGRSEALPVGLALRKGAIELLFSEPLDPETAADPESFDVSAFEVKSSADYGSPEYLPDGAGKRGREAWPVSRASLAEDGRRLRLEIPALKPVSCLVLKASLRSAAGRPLRPELSLTINALPE